MSDKWTRSEAAGSGDALVGFGRVRHRASLSTLPQVIVLAVGLVWGFWVVADSAQFSTIVTEVVEARFVGTALTMQLAAGFTLTVFTIFLVPIVRDAHGWGWAFCLLAPGPMLGAWAMRALRMGPKRVPEPEPPSYVSPFF